uniref:NB-ARC domain-containing disease resistance protein n=1 Tax=Populus tomentosa TaxID=118781 RepID=A0A385JHQ9_POPTO|nr:NB-ARC domain-containing disease resistance protein [Populus tomentosa]
MAIESVGGSIISKIAELMVEPVGRQFRYMFCFNNFVEEFKERKENLYSAKERLQNIVEDAKTNAEEIEKVVKKWLEDANNEIEGVKPLENEIGKNGKCFTWCPNCMRQFKLSKALANKSETLRKLEEISEKFKTVSHKAHLQPIEFLPSKEFTPSESSKEALEQIMKALKDDSVNMIGLYGMGGVGKTTLVKEVGRRAKELQLFPEVLMATVSQNPNVTDIQDRMADKLRLDIKEKSREGRADRLRHRLKEVEKMLIILDDVWEDIDLKEIGIPFGDDHRGCKILLTTRFEHICSSMECQQKVFLRVLSEDEALALFRINAGLRDGDSTLNTVAREVARECHGLPIALVTVGRALRDKSLVQWEVASKQLKDSQFPRMEQIDKQKNAYTCLKLSYDYLKFEETKSCFVLCCLFPEDYDIPIEDLMRYAVGYGLHQDAEPIEDARKRVFVAIENLKDCCMLLGTETGEHKWPMSNTSFEGCTTISLMGNKLAELPEGLVCPKLKVLLLEVDYGLNVPQRFFEGIREIEVLSLNGGRLSLQSLELSTKLQSLVLIMCGCKDLIWLRKLQRLKILGLMWCLSIEELPDEIGELKELRLLDVTGCERLSRIPVNLIGRLKKLEELLIGDGSFEEWDVVGCDSTGGMNASLKELNSLSQLAVLSLRIPKVECIPRDFVFPSLHKYDIVLGNRFDAGGYPTSTRLNLAGTSATSLNVMTFELLFPTVSQIIFTSLEGLKNIELHSDHMTNHGHELQKGFLQRLEFVQVQRCGDICTLFPAKLRQALKHLKKVIIDSCKSLEEVFELGEVDEESNEEKEMPLLSSLTMLELQGLPELKCIWKGATRHVSLQSLAHLKVWSLDKLTFIFTPSLAQSLPQLETLEIEKCGELKHIIREQDGEREIIPESPGFPKLKTLLVSGCGKLEYVFPVSVSPSLPNLEQMTIYYADNLKQIFYGGEGDALTRDDIIKFPQLKELSLRLGSNYSFLGPRNFAVQLPSLQKLTIHGRKELGNWLAQLQQKGFLQRLRFVEVNDCGDVRTPFPAKLLQALKNLSSVDIESCKSLEEVFELGEVDEESNEEKELSLLSSLTTLLLIDLPELRCIWKGLLGIEKDDEREIISESLRFPRLKTIFIEECGKLEYVFPVSVSPSLLNLEEMGIFYAHNLKQIFYSGEGDALTTDGIIKFPRLRKLSLSSRSNFSFFGPKNFAAQLPSLQCLIIDGHEELGNLLAKLQELTSLKTLRLGSLLVPDMRCLWKGLVLSNLTTLVVYECKRLTHVFSDSMIASLVQLNFLNIESCEELEQIIARDNDDGKDQIVPGDHLQSLCFPNLCMKTVDSL